jgi:hypothetical protein
VRGVPGCVLIFVWPFLLMWCGLVWFAGLFRKKHPFDEQIASMPDDIRDLGDTPIGRPRKDKP